MSSLNSDVSFLPFPPSFLFLPSPALAEPPASVYLQFSNYKIKSLAVNSSNIFVSLSHLCVEYSGCTELTPLSHSSSIFLLILFRELLNLSKAETEPRASPGLLASKYSTSPTEPCKLLFHLGWISLLCRRALIFLVEWSPFAVDFISVNSV